MTSVFRDHGFRDPPILCSACGAHLQIDAHKGPSTCSVCGKFYCSSCYSIKLKLDAAPDTTAGACTSCDDLTMIRSRVSQTAKLPQHLACTDNVQQPWNKDQQQNWTQKPPNVTPRHENSTYTTELLHKQKSADAFDNRNTQVLYPDQAGLKRRTVDTDGSDNRIGYSDKFDQSYYQVKNNFSRGQNTAFTQVQEGEWSKRNTHTPYASIMPADFDYVNKTDRAGLQNKSYFQHQTDNFTDQRWQGLSRVEYGSGGQNKVYGNGNGSYGSDQTGSCSGDQQHTEDSWKGQANDYSREIQTTNYLRDNHTKLHHGDNWTDSNFTRGDQANHYYDGNQTTNYTWEGQEEQQYPGDNQTANHFRNSQTKRYHVDEQITTNITRGNQANDYHEGNKTMNYTREGQTTHYVGGGEPSNYARETTGVGQNMRQTYTGDAKGNSCHGVSNRYGTSHDQNYYDYDEEEFDHDEYVPPYDEIPYALILAGTIDDRTLKRAKFMQQQKMALQQFGIGNQTQTREAPTQRNVGKKNKNMNMSNKQGTKTEEKAKCTLQVDLHKNEISKKPESGTKSTSGLVTHHNNEIEVSKKSESELKPTSGLVSHDKDKIEVSKKSDSGTKPTSGLVTHDKDKIEVSKKSDSGTKPTSGLVTCDKHKIEISKKPELGTKPSGGLVTCDKDKIEISKKTKQGPKATSNLLTNDKEDNLNIHGLFEPSKTVPKKPEQNVQSMITQAVSVVNAAKQEDKSPLTDADILRNKRLKRFNTELSNKPVSKNQFGSKPSVKESDKKDKMNKTTQQASNSHTYVKKDSTDEGQTSTVTNKTSKIKNESTQNHVEGDKKNIENNEYLLHYIDDVVNKHPIDKPKDKNEAKLKKESIKTRLDVTKSQTYEISAVESANQDETKNDTDVDSSTGTDSDNDDVPYAIRLAKGQESFMSGYKETRSKEKKSNSEKSETATSGKEVTGTFPYPNSSESDDGGQSFSLMSPLYEQSDKGTKSKVKNKNKNMTLTSKSKNETSTEDKTVIIIFSPSKSGSPDSLTTAEANKTGRENAKEIRKSTFAFIVPVADSRHRAFKRVRQSQSESHLNCTTCGRPECKSRNMIQMKEMIKAAKAVGFEVRDVNPDGNCMFAAIVDQLGLHKDYRFGPTSLREAAVAWLIDNPCSDDGTHYQSFIEDSWDVYLRRMVGDGQWGDHIVLRAIVNVIGHTVKVLNIGNSDSHWTILEPRFIDKKKDDKDLILGHVGEFHYTSLRPTDGQGSFTQAPLSPTHENCATEPAGQEALEGSESVEMFREDYIDPWGDIPAAHFSYLLKTVIPITCLDEAAIFTSQLCDQNVAEMPVESDLSEIEEPTGSVAESVFVKHLTTNVTKDHSMESWVDLNVMLISKTNKVVNKTDPERQANDYIIDEAGVHPGYTKLIQSEMCGSSADRVTRYIPNSFKKNIASRQRWQEMVKYMQRSVVVCETSTCLAYTCPSWPEVAMSWKTRVRREGWPSEEMIATVISEGCLVIPHSHKKSQDSDIEWQFSFALAQKKLFRESLSPNQKYCFILLKALCDQTLKQLTSISPDHIKSVFFYACERIPADFWSASPGACVLYMLDELARYVREKNFPNYFIQTNNMVDTLLEKDFKNVEDQINLLRSQPLLFLRQIHESAAYLYQGNEIIEKVSDDIPIFKVDRNVQRSTLLVFVPSTIKVATDFIKHSAYEMGYNILTKAYEERLSVTTCDDSVPFQIFLHGALSGLDQNTLIWFSVFADKHLEGQVSNSLVADLCAGMPLIKIKEIVPVSLAGGYGNTEVPAEFSQNIFHFCNDFATFLFKMGKMMVALPVLLFAVEKYNENLQNRERRLKGDEHLSESADEDDRNLEYQMMGVFTGIVCIHGIMRTGESLDEIVQQVVRLCYRINDKYVYGLCITLYPVMVQLVRNPDPSGLQAMMQKFQTMPTVEDPAVSYRYNSAAIWMSNMKKYIGYQSAATYPN